jgi:hypothetical protein
VPPILDPESAEFDQNVRETATERCPTRIYFCFHCRFQFRRIAVQIISVLRTYTSSHPCKYFVARVTVKVEAVLFCSWPDDYKVGLTPKILLNINVTNKGENAYDTQCFIQLPAGVEYVSANSSSIVRDAELRRTLMKIEYRFRSISIAIYRNNRIGLWFVNWAIHYQRM